MIRFQCPNCDSKLSAQDDKAGKTATCPKCKTAVKIEEVPIVPPPVTTPPPLPKKPIWKRKTTWAVGVSAIVLVTLLSMGVNSAIKSGDAATQRIEEMAMLKNIGLSLQNFYDQYKRLPKKRFEYADYCQKTNSMILYKFTLGDDVTICYWPEDRIQDLKDEKIILGYMQGNYNGGASWYYVLWFNGFVEPVDADRFRELSWPYQSYLLDQGP